MGTITIYLDVVMGTTFTGHSIPIGMTALSHPLL
jgi:hypothetical protein